MVNLFLVLKLGNTKDYSREGFITEQNHLPFPIIITVRVPVRGMLTLAKSNISMLNISP